ncbi:MAG TPA: GNAT family N-acetyltransferase [Spirochaetota bacterium]|nr:GNAT family N-acetyltransferase [Spirochaetota bacterium]HPI91161.1 GNAT family N-acetyltransferase [Spirochaetota bacterium]HPR49457.1 GNAT family N-acetyltransferase [Spirochaetota bacterium]
MNALLIGTERLLLRKPLISDSGAVFTSYARDPDVSRYLTWRPHKTIDETKGFIEFCIRNFNKDSFLAWCIIRRADNKLLGMVHLVIKENDANFGYVLLKDAWGKGYATEALKAVIEYGFSLRSIQRIWGICDTGNPASARVMEKAGLCRDSILKKHIVHPNVSDEPRDVYRYSRNR